MHLYGFDSRSKHESGTREALGKLAPAVVSSYFVVADDERRPPVTSKLRLNACLQLHTEHVKCD